MADKSQMADRVGDMFDGCSVLVSGGTGFLGKVLVEKLLRVTKVKTLYILIRDKRGKIPNERLKEMFKNPLFDLLRKTKPEAFEKCKAISGDVTVEGLGLKEKDRRTLTEVSFIFHSAATTRFDDTMRYAVIMNTRGTKLMLDLAKECKQLKLFVHISTAYVCPKEEVLYEKVYQPPADPHDVLNSLSWIKDDTMSGFTKALLGDCPNTYTFTKALAEALVAEEMDKLPVIIVRPSVVIPALKEPLPGWCNNLQGPMGLFVGAGKGIIRSMYMNSSGYVDFLPVDMVINGTLVASWDYVTNKQRRVFNMVSGKFYKLTWEEILEIGKFVIENRMPFNGIVWYPGGSAKKSKTVHQICFYAFQIVPAIFIDALLMILGYKPVLYQIQRRIQKGSEMFEYYTQKAWKFDNSVILSVSELLNDKERETYKLDSEGIDVTDYLTKCIHSVRIVNLKETDDMLPAARRNMKIMWCVDKLVKCLLVFGILYYSYKVLVSMIA